MILTDILIIAICILFPCLVAAAAYALRGERVRTERDSRLAFRAVVVVACAISLAFLYMYFLVNG